MEFVLGYFTGMFVMLIITMSFNNGGKWQAEKMYSEEEVLDILFKHTEYFAGFGERVSLTEWFKKFKKK